jgi:hypothetical protein
MQNKIDQYVIISFRVGSKELRTNSCVINMFIRYILKNFVHNCSYQWQNTQCTRTSLTRFIFNLHTTELYLFIYNSEIYIEDFDELSENITKA